ncbi:MAG: hypothetical protein ACK58L_08655, partial [Planctomycetota bacterium]
MENIGETVSGLGGGAPGGAKWGEIRGLIARCDDLPAGVRDAVLAMGDGAVVGLVGGVSSGVSGSDRSAG